MKLDEREAELRSLPVGKLVKEYRRVLQITPDEGPNTGDNLVAGILELEFPDSSAAPRVADGDFSCQTERSLEFAQSAGNAMEQIHQDADSSPSQVELYEDLRRIGELEDQKTAIQTEIDAKTEKLRQALKTVDTGSLLHKVLTAALSPATPVVAKRKVMRKKKRTKRKGTR